MLIAPPLPPRPPYPPFDKTDPRIKTYLGQLACIVGIKDNLSIVHEMTVNLTQMFPGLLATNAVNLALFTNNTAEQFAVGFTSHGRVDRGTVAWPQPSTTRSNYRIFETNPAAWNKVCLGLAIASNIAPESGAYVPEHIGKPQNTMWERLLGISYAAAWSVYFRTPIKLMLVRFV